MRITIILAALTLALGCGKKEPVQPAAINSEVTKPETEKGKEATQPITPNPETTKPEPTKAKATAGVKLWEFKTGSDVGSSPTIGSDGTVYVGSDDNKLYAINGKSGVKLWEFETKGDLESSPAIGSDGTVYVGSFDKKLYALSGKTGVKLWEFETGFPEESSPAIGSDGTVYFGSSLSFANSVGTKLNVGRAKAVWWRNERREKFCMPEASRYAPDWSTSMPGSCPLSLRRSTAGVLGILPTHGPRAFD